MEPVIEARHTRELASCWPLRILQTGAKEVLTLLLSSLAQVLTLHLDCSLCCLFWVVWSAVPRFAALKVPAKLYASAAHQSCSVTGSQISLDVFASLGEPLQTQCIATGFNDTFSILLAGYLK